MLLSDVETLDNPKRYFGAVSICVFMGYRSPGDAVRRLVPAEHRIPLRKLLDDTSGFTYNQLKRIFIDEDALVTLLQKSRLPGSRDREIIDHFNLNAKIIVKSKEQTTVNQITSAFAHFAFEFQYTVDMYRVDLYLPAYRLAIECDEFGHAHRDEYEEREREKYIARKLNCSFVRYNPDEPDFDICKTINKIMLFVYA